MSLPKKFNLLSIGQRGVGKTVFLLGSYLELRANHLTKRQQKLWFECQESQGQENLEKMLNYVNQTHQYPPATMKILNFNFWLKQQNFWGKQTSCHFQWHDIPGEICEIHNPDFRQMVFNSHGCCIFIDAYALKYSESYSRELKEIFEQVIALASLAFLNHFRYPFLLILTKSDLLENDSSAQEIITKKLEPLTKNLQCLHANYQIFQSFIPLIRNNEGGCLQAKGAASALFWLVWELQKIHAPSLNNQLVSLVNRILTSNHQPSHQEEIATAPIKAIFNLAARPSDKNKLLNPKLLVLGLIIAGVSSAILIILLVSQDFNFNRANPQEISGHNHLGTLQHYLEVSPQEA